MSLRLFERMLFVVVGATLAAAQGVEDLVAGHWVIVRGHVDGEDFIAEELELSLPGEEEVLIGTITEASSGGDWFSLLGMRVSVDEDTRWRIDEGELVGQRVKVEGHYRGPRKFSASSVSRRGAGRDRIAGRVDAIRTGEREVDVMRWIVRLPDNMAYKREVALEGYPLMDPRGVSRKSALDAVRSLRAGRDDDDDVPVSLQLTDELAVGLRLDMERADEREFDLNPSDAEDRIDDEASLRLELLWTPSEDFYALAGFRHRWRWRDDEEDGSSRFDRGKVAEAYGYWKDVGGLPLDVQIGRQDFDEPREWLWDENLDAARLIAYPAPDWRVEFAAATTLRDGNPRQEATEAYLASATWGNEDRSLGAWVLDTRTDLAVKDYPLHFGVRALGEWVEDHDVWFELAHVAGYEGSEDISGYAYDLGTTWSPSSLEPWYFTAGYAFGSGDDNPVDGVDRAFRQTGLQDNNAKFGGVTSFKYYGELLQPELSNLEILTFGIGRRFGNRHSIDLVHHTYTQVELSDRFRSTDLSRRPNGLSREIGSELDLILGSRISDSVHLEFVMARFQGGAAFPSNSDDAFLGRLQLRVRF